MRPARTRGRGALCALAFLLAAAACNREQHAVASPQAPGAALAVDAGKVPAKPLPTCPGALERNHTGTYAASCAFTIALRAGEFIDLVAQQRGIDVALRLYAPNGSLLAQSDRPNYTAGAERLEAVAPSSGSYRLEIVRGGAAVHGQADVSLVARRRASRRDRERADNAALLATDDTAALARAQATYERWNDHELAALAARLRGALARRRQDTPAERAALLQARSLAQRAGDAAEEARVLAELAQAEAASNAPEQARAYYERALTLGRREHERSAQATALMGLGVLAREAHAFPTAWQHFSAAAALWQEAEDPRNEARTRTHAGIVATWLGRRAEARDAFRAAEALNREQLGRGAADAPDWILDRAVNASWLAWVEHMAGDAQAAELQRAVAAQLFRRVNSVDGQIWLATTSGQAFARRGQIEAAREAFRRGRALAGTDPRYRVLGARLLGSLGAAELGPGGNREAGLRALREALPLARASGDDDEVAFCLRKLAWVAMESNDLEQADRLTSEAWHLIEGLRAASINTTSEPDLLGARQEHAAARLEVLVRRARAEPGRGHEERAYEFLELSRARTLRERIKVVSGTVAQSGVDRSTYEALLVLVRAKRAARAQVRAAQPEVHARLRATVTLLETELAGLERALRRSDISKITPPDVGPGDLSIPNLARIRRELLDDATRILAITLGDPDVEQDGQARVWLVSRERVQIVDIGRASTLRATAERLARDWRDSDYRRARLRAMAAATALGERLLPPEIASQLVDVKRLIVIAESALLPIPLASLALPPELAATGAQPVSWVERFELVYGPSATALAELRARARSRAAAPRAVAVMADPVFSQPDEECRDGQPVPPALPVHASSAPQDADHPALRRLCRSGEEAAVLRHLVPNAQRLERLRYAATSDAVRHGDLSGYRVVHLATHGFVLDKAELTRLVFSRFAASGRPLAGDGSLGADDIAGLKVPADLVVLSACRTNLGREVRGEGLQGLTQAFMAAGATQVLASLWSVEDRATAQLMQFFYRALADGQPAAQALQSAQVSMLRNPKYSAPFYWAGFVLQGDGGRVRLIDQTNPLNAGLSKEMGARHTRVGEERVMHEHDADSNGRPARRADGPHTPPPPPPGDKGNTLSDGTARPTVRTLTGETNASGSTPAPKVPPPPKDPNDPNTLGTLDDAQGGTPPVGPVPPKTEWVLRDGVKVLGNPFDTP